MTIDEARTQIAALETNITALLRSFQTDTGLVIHSIPVTENGGANSPITARVKVQL